MNPACGLAPGPYFFVPITCGGNCDEPVLSGQRLLTYEKFGSSLENWNVRPLPGPPGNIWLMLYLGSIWVTPTVVGRLLLVVGALVEPPDKEVKENCAVAGPTSTKPRIATAINGKSLRTLCLPLASCQRLNCENSVPRGEENSVGGNCVKTGITAAPVSGRTRT